MWRALRSTRLCADSKRPTSHRHATLEYTASHRRTMGCSECSHYEDSRRTSTSQQKSLPYSPLAIAAAASAASSALSCFVTNSEPAFTCRAKKPHESTRACVRHRRPPLVCADGKRAAIDGAARRIAVCALRASALCSVCCEVATATAGPAPRCQRVQRCRAAR